MTTSDPNPPPGPRQPDPTYASQDHGPTAAPHVKKYRRFIQWFIRRHQRFRDHRTLFNLAPKFALLTAMIAAVPFFVYLLQGSTLVLLIITIAGSGLLFALVYLAFMVFGGMEYEHEIKNDRLARAYDELSRYASRVQDDLSRARTVQQRTLPGVNDLPMPDHISWAFSFLPADEVGGDFYDAAQLRDGRLAVIFGDVSGHGMAAAFITAVVKTAFQTWTEDHSTLAEFISRLNRHLVTLTPDDSFAAAFFMLYDPATRQLTYTNAGHHPEPWLIPASPEQPIQTLSSARAMLLGIQSDVPLCCADIQLHPGDKVMFVTDGLVEARDAAGELYGCTRIEQDIEARRHAAVDDLVAQIVNAVQSFMQPGRQLDDQTVLAFQVK